jgi:RNA polymerase sigma-70 factor (ECF subfamily)
MDYASIPADRLPRVCAESSDPAAWEEFVRRFHRLIATVVFRTARRWGDCSPLVLDDIIQEIYLKLCGNHCRLLREFTPVHPDAIFGFLKVIAANATNDHFKTLHTARRGGGRITSDPEEAVAAEPQRGGLSAIEREILIGEIDACLRRCLDGPNRDRDCNVFWLHYQAGMSASAIAAMPSISLTAKGVESIIHRLTCLLRKELAEIWEKGRPGPKGFSETDRCSG